MSAATSLRLNGPHIEIYWSKSSKIGSFFISNNKLYGDMYSVEDPNNYCIIWSILPHFYCADTWSSFITKFSSLTFFPFEKISIQCLHFSFFINFDSSSVYVFCICYSCKILKASSDTSIIRSIISDAISILRALFFFIL